MADEPKQGEVGEVLSSEDCLEVELDERRARKTRVVAKESEPPSVRYHGPEVVVGAVEKFLHERWGTGLRRN